MINNLESCAAPHQHHTGYVLIYKSIHGLFAIPSLIVIPIDTRTSKAQKYHFGKYLPPKSVINGQIQIDQCVKKIKITH